MRVLDVHERSGIPAEVTVSATHSTHVDASRHHHAGSPVRLPGGQRTRVDSHAADYVRPCLSSQIAAGRASGRTLSCVRELRFTDEKDASRFTLHRGDDLVSVLDYRDDGRSVAMTRAYTIPTFRGSGFAAELVDRAVAQLEAAGDREVIPVCWYVADWFDAHPERAGILRARHVS